MKFRITMAGGGLLRIIAFGMNYNGVFDVPEEDVERVFDPCCAWFPLRGPDFDLMIPWAAVQMIEKVKESGPEEEITP